MCEIENDNDGNHPEFVCSICKTTQTPMWRKGPSGKNTLCNRCGIKWSRIQNPRKKSKRGVIKSEFKNGFDGTLSEDSSLVQPLISPSNSDREDSYDIVEEEKSLNSITQERISSEQEKLSYKPSTSYIEVTVTRSSSHPKSFGKRKPSPPPKHRISTRLAKRPKRVCNRMYDSDDEQHFIVPSALDLLQKIRDSKKTLLNLELPEMPLEPRHLRFFNHATQELEKAKTDFI